MKLRLRKYLFVGLILSIAIMSGTYAYTNYYQIQNANVVIQNSNVTIYDSNVTVNSNPTTCKYLGVEATPLYIVNQTIDGRIEIWYSLPSDSPREFFTVLWSGEQYDYYFSIVGRLNKTAIGSSYAKQKFKEIIGDESFPPYWNLTGARQEPLPWIGFWFGRPLNVDSSGEGVVITTFKELTDSQINQLSDLIGSYLY